MTSERDIDRILDHWFAERPTEAPDRVLDEVAGRLGRQPQQPGWLVLWRDSHVNTYVKYAAAIAAVILVAAVGFAILRPSSAPNVGGGTATPSPSPTALATPSAAPPAAAGFPEWYTAENGGDGVGILPPGSATTQRFLPGSTFNVPAGWVNSTDTADFYGLFPDAPANQAEFGLSGDTAQGIFMGLVDTPSGLICEGVETHGSTAAELVDSLVANEALVTSEPVDVNIGGLTGTRVDAHIDPDSAGSCPLAPEDPPTRDYKDYRGRFVFLDIPSGGKLLIIVDSVHAADFDAFVAEAMPIVESFQFNLAP